MDDARRQAFIEQKRAEIARLPLGKKQELFSRSIIIIIQIAHLLGYEVRCGDLYRNPDTCSHGHQSSTHHKKLAFDMNLMLDGALLEDGTGHDVIHDFWDMIGGSKRIPNDLNHYSFEHNGVR